MAQTTPNFDKLVKMIQEGKLEDAKEFWISRVNTIGLLFMGFWALGFLSAYIVLLGI